MKSFHCQYCDQLIFFENVQCVTCGHTLGYLPDMAIMSALEPADGVGMWWPLAEEAQARLYRMCRNYSQENVCNWMVPAEDEQVLCRSCRFNQTTPDLSQPGALACWHRLETGKRRLVYSLLCLKLPVRSKEEDPEKGLAFAFLGDPNPSFEETSKVITGHANGLITLNIAEADDAIREKMRLTMNERYRTVLGHFRHESGHHYWERLVVHSEWLAPFRELFRDEREDYDRALKCHYEQGPPQDWPQRFISAYASAHPWEDWAETWAHYLHIVDTMETAREFGLQVRPRQPNEPKVDSRIKLVGCRPESFDKMLDSWVPLTYVINSINRSMGQPDMYPFVLSTPAVDKLRFVHAVIARAGQG
jgi:hypothetical protein